MQELEEKVVEPGGWFLRPNEWMDTLVCPPAHRAV